MNKKTIPFNLFTALKIQAGITKGRFITQSGHAVRIVCWNGSKPYPVIGLVENIEGNPGYQEIKTYTLSGSFMLGSINLQDLLIELDEEGEK